MVTYGNGAKIGMENIKKINPKGSTKGIHRVIRGGGWYSNSWYTHCSKGLCVYPTEDQDDIGFRLVRLKKTKLEKVLNNK